MGWPTTTNFAARDSVKIRRAVVSQDGSKGREYKYPTGWEPSQYGCAVLVASGETVARFSRDDLAVRYTVVAASKLGKVRDQFLWTEIGAILTIVSIQPSGEVGSRTWDHHCEEHPI